jgi:lipopolysaccharide/colanic/teichoic acid biosynthesis glycosyltransferase
MNALVKRTEDLLVCLLALLIFVVPFVVIALAIYLSERSSIFFIQKRLGRAGEEFKVLKFRTMTEGQVTFVGRWLRKTGLDELPQIINIARGEMSFVGPRPLTREDVGRLSLHKNFKSRWDVKPGLTGLAQIYAGKGLENSMNMDREYIERQSLLLDIQIMAISFLMASRYFRTWSFGLGKIPEFTRISPH